jgi:hypothetical protein
MANRRATLQPEGGGGAPPPSSNTPSSNVSAPAQQNLMFTRFRVGDNPEDTTYQVYDNNLMTQSVLVGGDRRVFDTNDRNNRKRQNLPLKSQENIHNPKKNVSADNTHMSFTYHPGIGTSGLTTTATYPPHTRADQTNTNIHSQISTPISRETVTAVYSPNMTSHFILGPALSRHLAQVSGTSQSQHTGPPPQQSGPPPPN